MTTIAVLGLGSIGLRHARNFAALDARVIGFDPSPDRVAIAEGEGIAATSDRAAALDSADAIVIASPSGRHLADLAEAAERGLHVLAEKPLAHTSDGIPALLDAFARKGRIVFAGLNLRYHPALNAGRALLRDGRLGDILWARFQMSDYLPTWRPHTDYRKGYANDPVSGGVLFDIIHEFDAAHFLLGPGAVAAAAARRTGALDIEAEDCADVLIRHDTGVVSALHLDFVTRPRTRRYEVAGTSGVVTIDLDGRALIVTDVDGKAGTQSFPGSYADDYVAEARDFLDCVEKRTQPTCTGHDALTVLEQVLHARKLSGLPTS